MVESLLPSILLRKIGASFNSTIVCDRDKSPKVPSRLPNNQGASLLLPPATCSGFTGTSSGGSICIYCHMRDAFSLYARRIAPGLQGAADRVQWEQHFREERSPVVLRCASAGAKRISQVHLNALDARIQRFPCTDTGVPCIEPRRRSTDPQISRECDRTVSIAKDVMDPF